MPPAQVKGHSKIRKAVHFEQGRPHDKPLKICPQSVSAGRDPQQFAEPL